jgi:hypothetical protein
MRSKLLFIQKCHYCSLVCCHISFVV